MRKTLFILVLVCITAVSTLNVLFSYQIQFIIDALTHQNQTAFMNNILWMMLIMFLLLVIEYFRQYLNTRYLNQVGLSIHKSIITKLYNLNFLEYKSKSSGEYLSILNNDIDTIKTFHYDAIISLYQGIITFIIACIALFSLDPLTAGLIIIVSIFPILIPYIFKHQTRKNKNQLSKNQSIYNTYLKDFVTGLLDIKNFRTSNVFVDKVNERYEEVNQAEQKNVKLTALINVLIGLFFYGCVVCILLIGGRQVLNGSITVGALASIIALSNELEMPVNLIADNLSSINSVKDIKQKYDAKGDRTADDVPITTHIESLQQIDIQNLAYSIDHQKIFEDFNYQFERGKKYLIVGSSGRGKSTLAYLITKNLDPDQGTILYNHVDRKHVSYQEVQDHIGLISQHSIIFADTVLNNLHLYQELPIEMTQQLLEQFSLDERFNDWNELIIEDGNLSGGQKQRMIIIRTLLQNKKFIILDESLSALDKENYHRIEKYLLNQDDICLINITHRDSSNLSQYDQVLDLDQLD